MQTHNGHENNKNEDQTKERFDAVGELVDTASLDITGTTVFVYDIKTQTYKLKLLNEEAANAVFERFEFREQLLRSNIISKADIDRIRNSMSIVESGETLCVTETVKLLKQN